MLLNHWLASWCRGQNGYSSMQGIGKRARRVAGRNLDRIEALEGRALLTNIDLAALGAAGTTIFGADEGDESGYAVSSAGDLNGDGFDDIIIGAYDADGVANLEEGAGESYVIFGSANPPGLIDLANLGSAGITIFGEDQFDIAGGSVSRAGDVNGDGYDDVIIGADRGQGLTPNENVAGRSYVIFGGSSLPLTIDLAALSNAGITILGKDNGDHGGKSVSGAGDVNGDGFDDFLIGANSSDGVANANNYAGETYLFFGGAALPSTIDLANTNVPYVTIFGADPQDKSGKPVSGAGDVNGDGFADLIIGAAYAAGAGNATQNSGESYIVFGGTALPLTIELSNLGSAGITIYGIDPTDFSGASVRGAGDLNSDGFDDVVIGAVGGDGANGTKATAGEVYVIFGGLQLDPVIDLKTLGSKGVTLFGAGNLDLTGASVAGVGDVNGDGYDDLLIGASRSSSLNDQRDDAGEAVVIYGNPNLPETIDLANLGPAGFVIYGADENDRAGWSVNAAGDVNGDGFEDLIIGALYGGGGPENAKPKAGETYVIYGGDFTSAVTHPGTTAGETLTGTNSADSIIGGLGNDLLLANGGADVAYGGAGDDILSAISLDFLKFDGGNGTDTLRLDGGGMSLDLTTLDDHRLLNIETIDLRGTGANSLTVNLHEVLSLTNNSNSQHTANTLTVLRDADDTVTMGAGWTQGNNIVIDGVIYEVFTQGVANLHIGIPGAPGLLKGPDVTWVKKDAPIVVLPQITVSGDNLGGGTLSIAVNVVGTKKKTLDDFQFPAVGALGSSSGPQTTKGQLTLQIQLAANTQPADVQAFLRSITFSTRGNGLKTPTRKLQVTLTDSSDLYISVAQTIHVSKKR